MRIQITLHAADESASETTVSSIVEVAPDDLHCPARLAGAVAARAQEGTHQLRQHLLPAPVRAGRRFVPLADVVPIVGP